MGNSSFTTAVCTTRRLFVGISNGLCLRSAFGILAPIVRTRIIGLCSHFFFEPPQPSLPLRSFLEPSHLHSSTPGLPGWRSPAKRSLQDFPAAYPPIRLHAFHSDSLASRQASAADSELPLPFPAPWVFYPLLAITLFSVCLEHIDNCPPSLHPDFRGFLFTTHDSVRPRRFGLPHPWGCAAVEALA